MMNRLIWLLMGLCMVAGCRSNSGMPEDVRAKQSGQPDRSMGVSPMDHGQDARATQEDSGKSMPTLFLVGDSTVKNGTKGQVGWGQVIGKYFDSSKIHVENHAIGGRSSRTFITEGRWDKVLGEGKPGDYVIIQLGHNDGGPLDDPARARGTIRGIGDESKQIFNPITKQNEVVHTYGWYMRKYVEDARGHGMTPIICSPVPHWQSHVIASGEVEKSGYVQWSHEVAQQEHCLFIPLNKIVMSHWAGMPADQVHSKYFADPHTHSTPAGAELNARCVVEGIRELKHCDLKKYLLAE